MLPKVKICGITRQEDAELAIALGAVALGFVFHPSSPRAISEERAAAIIATLPPFVSAVGVFVEQQSTAIGRLMRRCRLDCAQLHGDASAAELGRVLALGHRAYRAFRLHDEADPQVILAQDDRTLLLDAHHPQHWGGTGRTIDWKQAAQISAARRVILAGGLTAANIVEAVERVRPYAVDLSSSLEVQPGRKDAVRMHRFFDQLKQARG